MLKRTNNSTKYYYKVYGLNIISELEINEFEIQPISTNENENINIKVAKVPYDVRCKISDYTRTYISKDEIWFQIDDVGIYWITSGKTIVVEPFDNCDYTLLRVYILGIALGFILLQRNEIALHGSCLLVKNKGILLTGKSGAGKSTLAAALENEGHKFITDDIGKVSFKNSPFIEPGFPFHKLSLDVHEKLSKDISQCSIFTTDNKTKALVPDKENFLNSPIGLDAIFEISPDDVMEVSILEITGVDKIRKIQENIFINTYTHQIDGLKDENFKKCIYIAKHIKFYVIKRPKNAYCVNEQLNLIYKALPFI